MGSAGCTHWLPLACTMPANSAAVSRCVARASGVSRPCGSCSDSTYTGASALTPPSLLPPCLPMSTSFLAACAAWIWGLVPRITAISAAGYAGGRMSATAPAQQAKAWNALAVKVANVARSCGRMCQKHKMPQHLQRQRLWVLRFARHSSHQLETERNACSYTSCHIAASTKLQS